MAEEPKAIEKVATGAAAVSVGQRGVMLNNLAELMSFAKVCFEGGVAPKGMSIAGAAIAIQAGMERGLGPIGGLQAAVVINGVLSWRGAAAVGFIQNSAVIVPGTFKSWVENPGTDQAVGYCRAQRRGYDQPFVRTFSVMDAKKAGLWRKDGPWQTRPDNMLEWRAIGDMGRFHFWDVLGNLPIAEDVEAGGVGTTEPVAELPAKRLPEPPPPVADPILAELAPPLVLRDTEIVQTETGIKMQTPGTEFQKLETAMTPVAIAESTRAIIDAQVNELFGPATMHPGNAPKLCQRCKSLLNAMDGCDVCGWPGPDNGERP